jgi:aryl-alcohol dehydrogenase-like predicted oxidoreductase
MNTRQLGNSDLHFSTLGLGTWAQGGTAWAYGWGEQDDRASIDTIAAAVDAGMNWIDTAAVYGFGHAEVVLGQALKELSTKPFIATKCARVPGEKGQPVAYMTAESVKQECEDSLKRLGIEVIDLYQMHWPEPEEAIEEGWQAMAELVAEGKVRHIGVSNFNVEQMQRCLPIHPITSLQPPYSMLRRDVETDILDFCAEQHIGVICYSPMQKGLLTGKVTADWVAALPEDDHRRRDPMFNPPKLEKILGQVAQLSEIAEGLGLSMAQLSIAWTLRHPAMTSAIVGGRRPDQVQETAKAGDVELSDDVMRDIALVLA